MKRPSAVLALTALASLVLLSASPSAAAEPLIAHNGLHPTRLHGPRWQKKVSFDFDGVELEYALTRLAKVVGCNVVTRVPTHKTVTAFMHNVPAARALAVILSTTGCEAKMIGNNTLFVGEPADVQRMSGVSSQPPPVIGSRPAVEVIQLHHAKAENVAATVRSVYPNVGVTALPQQNAIIIRVPAP